MQTDAFLRLPAVNEMVPILFGRILQLALLFATLKISTTLLSPAEMAKVFLVTSVASFYAMFLLNPVGLFMNQRLHAWNAAGKVKSYYGYFSLYLVIVCLLAVASLKIFIDAEMVNVHTSRDWVLLLVGGCLLISPANQVIVPGLNLLGHRGWYVALSLATSATSLMVAVLLVVRISSGAENRILGLLVGQMLFAAIGWKVLSSKLTPNVAFARLDRTHMRVLFAYSWPIAISVGLAWTQTQSYRFLMEPNLGLHELGLFAAGYGISAGIISAFESILTTYLLPIFYRRISGEDFAEPARAWNEYSGILIPTLLLVGLFILASTLELTRLLLGSAYSSASQFVVWGVIAELSRVFAGIYGLIAQVRMRTRLLMLPSFVGAILSILLVTMLMPLAGSNGVGLALALSSVVSLLTVVWVTRNEFSRRFNWKPVLCSLLMGAFLILSTESFRRFWGHDISITAIVGRLFVAGSIFVIFQYILLRSNFASFQK